MYATSEDYTTDLLELASSKVDELTFNRIVAIGFDNLTEFQRLKIKQATLLQAEYYNSYGTDAEALSGFSLNGTSMSFANGGVKGVHPLALSMLKQTGLMVRRL